jgi:hypothetical protein
LRVEQRRLIQLVSKVNVFRVLEGALEKQEHSRSPDMLFAGYPLAHTGDSAAETVLSPGLAARANEETLGNADSEKRLVLCERKTHAFSSRKTLDYGSLVQDRM